MLTSFGLGLIRQKPTKQCNYNVHHISKWLMALSLWTKYLAKNKMS